VEVLFPAYLLASTETTNRVQKHNTKYLIDYVYCLQCFDVVGWAARKASGL